VRSIDTLIRALKREGVWFSLDLLQVYCAGDAAAALLNWVKPGSNTATVGAGSPTFTPNLGYTFNGTTDYLNTNFTPNTHGVAMKGGAPVNMMGAAYERTNISSGSYALAGQNATGQSFSLRPRGSSNLMAIGVNCSATTMGSITDSRGLTVAQREADDTISVFKNGALSTTNGTVQSASVLSSQPLYVAARNNNSTADSFRASTIGAVAAGARLNPGQHLGFYNALQSYMTDLGANV
jgi:hypothetical protein